MATCAIVLAAGLSKRFKSGNKLLHMLDGKPLIQHIIDTLANSSVTESIVVVNRSNTGIEDAIRLTQASQTVRFAQNPDAHSGMACSIKTGLQALRPTDNVLVLLGDMPHVSTHTITALIESAKTHNDSIIFAPVFNAKRGNPVLFKAQCRGALLNLSGDTGAKAFIKANTDKLIEVSVNDPGVHRDYDTLADFHNDRHLSS